MANTKISALPASTTPLVGTEVLPIVKSGATVKVSVANLTSGRAVATAGGSFTDNIIQSTANKGINFTANTPAAGMTNQLLNWYEEGTWTPTDASGAGLTITYSDNKYTRIGRLVQLNALITYPTTANGATVTIGGIPFTAGNYAIGQLVGFFGVSGCITISPSGVVAYGRDLTGNTITNSVVSTKIVAISIAYMV